VRLIDAEPFDFNKVVIPDGGPNFMRGYGLGAKHVCDEIDAAPTIDAVPVTRCRDCVSSEYVIESNALPYYRCPYVNFDIYPDFYCAYGRERIADGRDHGPTDQG
jgi:hypothetical protein